MCRSWKFCTAALLGLLLTTLNPGFVAAQDGPLGGLLRDLIESELKRRQDDLRTQQNPGRIPQQPQPRIQVEVTKNQREVQRLCGSIATEANRLYGLCRAESRRIPGLQAHNDEFQKLSALARQMQADFGKPMPDRWVIDELQRLDNQWRVSKFHLQQTRGLPNSFQQPMNRLDQYLAQGCELYGIGPSLNNRELVRLFEALSTDLQRLGRDLRFVRSPMVQNLVMSLRRLETRAHLLAESVAAQDPYETVLAEFEHFGAEWAEARRTLDRIQDVHVARSVDEVQRLEASIREQLWLPPNLDFGHLQHLGELFQASCSSYIDSITLRDLMSSRDAQAILRAAQRFETQGNEFCLRLNETQDIDALVRSWETLDAAWRELDAQVRVLERPQTSQMRLQLVNQLTTIRNALGIQLVFDRDQATRYAAKLAGIADQQMFHVAQWQKRSNAGLRAATVRDLDRFVNDCRLLQSDCGSNVAQQQLFDQCNRLTQQWIALRPQLLECNTIDRNAIVRVADSMTDCIVHLQTLLQI